MFWDRVSRDKTIADELKETKEQIAKLENEKKDTARKMKSDGMPVELILKYTGLTAEEIEGSSSGLP